jgi:hypothetical protein
VKCIEHVSQPVPEATRKPARDVQAVLSIKLDFNNLVAI